MSNPSIDSYCRTRAGSFGPALVGLLLLASLASTACQPSAPESAGSSSSTASDPGADGAPVPAPDPTTTADPGATVSTPNPVYDPVAARRLTMEAVEYFDDSEFLAAREALRSALDHRPAYFEARRVLAAVEDALGRRADALEALRRVAESGLLAGFARDPRLEPLRSDPQWSAIVDSIDTAPLERGSTWFRLAERDLVTEDVAVDPRTGSVFVSSVHRRKIVRFSASALESASTLEPASATESLQVGETVWGGGPDGDAWSVLGMALDGERRRLWVVTSAMPNMLGFGPELEGRSSLVALALPSTADGALAVVERHDFHRSETLGAGPFLLNDVAVADDGTVYVSDHRAPVGLFRLRPGAREPEPFGDLELRSPQGLAVDRRGRVWLADYSYGLAVFDAQTGAGRWVDEGPRTCLLGIDGLAYEPRSGHLVAIQNVLPPHRILRLVPSADAARIERVEVLERAREEWIEPTLGSVVETADGPVFVYVGASQWNRFDREGRLPPADQLEPPLIYRLPLS